MSRRNRGRDRYVSATDIASLAFCEQKVVLTRQHGDKATPEQQQARERGLKHHQQHDATVRRHHNQAPTQRPSPCFIASHVYGPIDARTQELRAFRDHVLRRSAAGRWAVAVYYRFSPAVVRWLQRRPWATAAIRLAVDSLRLLVRRTTPRHPTVLSRPHN